MGTSGVGGVGRGAPLATGVSGERNRIGFFGGSAKCASYKKSGTTPCCFGGGEEVPWFGGTESSMRDDFAAGWQRSGGTAGGTLDRAGSAARCIGAAGGAARPVIIDTRCYHGLTGTWNFSSLPVTPQCDSRLLQSPSHHLMLKQHCANALVKSDVTGHSQGSVSRMRGSPTDSPPKGGKINLPIPAHSRTCWYVSHGASSSVPRLSNQYGTW